jgi:hypothetical protein
MKDWLGENPNGLKDAFEQYFKALPADVRKVSNHTGSNFPFSLALTLVCVQTYNDRATAAVRVSVLCD